MSSAGKGLALRAREPISGPMAGKDKSGSGRVRAERLKAALRENLRRRKAQARARARAAGPHDSAGFVADKPKG